MLDWDLICPGKALKHFATAYSKVSGISDGFIQVSLLLRNTLLQVCSSSLLIVGQLVL